MKKILYKIFGKPTYFYNPMLGKGEGENAFYTVDIYKYWMGKSTIIKCYADKNPLKVMAMARFFVNYVNQK